MNKLIITLLVAILILGAWWLWTTKSDTEPTIQPTEEVTSTGTPEAIHEDNLITRQPSLSDRQVYINQDWRFSFEYPANWVPNGLATMSKTSLFSLQLHQRDNLDSLRPFFINITPKWWGDRLINNKEGETLIGDRNAWYYNSQDSTISAKAFFILINNEYWVNLHIKNSYQESLQVILNSFKFHEPLPHLEDLDVEPYIPDYIKAQPISGD